MTQMTPEDYNSLDYEVTIHRKDNGYLLHLEELHLFAADQSLEAAYNKLRDAKDESLARYHALDLVHQIPLPVKLAEKEALKKSLMPFMIKLGAFALVAVLLITAANISLTYSLQQAPKKIAQKAGRAAIKNFGTTLEKIAKSEFTPEKEERIRQGIRKLVAALEPFMNEFEPLYRKQ